jgi:outer membrane protein
MRLKLIAGFAVSLSSAPLHADDLMSVYRDALSADPVYASARSAYEAAKEKIVQGRSLLLPNLGLTGNANYQTTNTDVDNPLLAPALDGNRSYPSWGTGLNLTQPLYRPQNNVTYKQAGIQVTQAESALTRSGQDLLFRVSQAYFDVLLAQFELRTATAQKTAIAEQLAQAKRNFEVGTATITDTYDAQARYDLVNAREIAARNAVEVQRRALQQIIGRVPGPLNTLASPLTLNPPEPNDMEQWVQAAFSTNLDVRIARDALELARQEVKKQRFGHYPTLDAVGAANYNRQDDSTFNTGYNQAQALVGLQFNLPIYQGGAISSRVREAIANQTKSEQDLETARRAVAQNVRQAFLAVTTGLSEIKALGQAVSSNRLSVEASKLGQEVGVRTQVDVLDAQGRLYEAERDLARAYYVAILAQLRLKQAVGRLTETDVENVNRLLSGPPRTD